MGRFDWLELPDSDHENKDKEFPESKDSRERFDPDYYLETANKKFGEGEFEGALRNYSRVIHLDKNNLSAWIGQVKALIKMGELSEAKVWAEKALSFFPDAPELLAAKAFLLYKSGLMENALVYTDKALANRGDSHYPWLVRGEILLSQRKTKLAGYCFEKAKEWGEDSKVFFEIGEAYFNNGMFIQAVECFKKSLENKSSSCFGWFKLAKAYEKLEFYERAKMSYSKALEIKPDFEEAKKCLNAHEVRGNNFFSTLYEAIKNLFLKEN